MLPQTACCCSAVGGRLLIEGATLGLDFNIVPDRTAAETSLSGALVLQGLGHPASAPVLSVHGGALISGDLCVRAVYHLSDRRRKCSVRPLSGALRQVLRLRGRSWHWLDGGGIVRNVRAYGLIAQEVRRCLPQAVQRNPKCGTLMVDHGCVLAYLLEAVRALTMRILKRRHRRKTKGPRRQPTLRT